MGSSFSSLKSAATEIKAAAESELFQMNSSFKSSSSRPKSNPRLLKPISSNASSTFISPAPNDNQSQKSKNPLNSHKKLL